MTKRVLWFDPTFGASGDMIMAVLVGLGAPLSEVIAGLDKLDIDGWSVTQSVVQRASLSAVRTEVTTTDGADHRAWTAIDTALANAPLSAPVADGARSTFRALAEVEAAIHGLTVDEVHFHEVGAVDAIVDIVGCWLALNLLAVDEVRCGPIGLGHGTVVAAHGKLPLPAPATAALLEGAIITSVDAEGETVTPTGAALLTTMVDHWGPLPTGILQATARGAGGRNPTEYPNVLSAHVIRQQADPGPEGTTMSPSVIIQANLDDVTGEVIAHTIARCLELGADDCWAHPIVMKKGRPGVELNILTNPDLVDRLRRTLFTETASLGLRTVSATKVALPRRFATVSVEGHPIAIKVGPHGAKPEFDDVAAAAGALSLSLTEVAQRALAAHRSSQN